MGLKRKSNLRKGVNSTTTDMWSAIDKKGVTLPNFLKKKLYKTVENLYEEKMGGMGRISTIDIFGKSQAMEIIDNLEVIEGLDKIELVIGGKLFSGQIQVIYDFILQFKS